MDAMRKSLAYAQRTLGIDRLLLSKDLCTEGGRVLLDRYGQLIDLSASGQIAMRKVFEEHLERVVWDEWKFPLRLYHSRLRTTLPHTDPSRSITRLRSGALSWRARAYRPRSLPSALTLAKPSTRLPRTTTSPSAKSRRLCSTSGPRELGLFHRS